MENASKALIIIGWMFIALIVMSVLVYFFGVYGGFSSDMHSRIQERYIAEYNSKFEKFDNRIDITYQEIMSLINFAKDSNIQNGLKVNGTDSGYNSSKFIRVYIKDATNPNFEFFKDGASTAYDNLFSNNVANRKMWTDTLNRYLDQYNDYNDAKNFYWCNIQSARYSTRVATSGSSTNIPIIECTTYGNSLDNSNPGRRRAGPFEYDEQGYINGIYFEVSRTITGTPTSINEQGIPEALTMGTRKQYTVVLK